MSKQKLLIIIVLISLFMRFYRLDNAVFGFDQNRDMLAMQKMVQDRRLPLLGPKEDRERAKFFFGPYHYYYFFPAYLVARGDPIGPLALAALGGAGMTWLLYAVGTRYFNKGTGLLAAFIHAGSFFFSDWERQFTNPYHLPLLTLGILYFLHKAIRENPWWIIPATILYGFAIQTHVAALFLLPVFLFYIHSFSLTPVLYAAVLFLVTLAPFIIFDLRHQGLNSQLIFMAVFKRSTSGTISLFENVRIVYDYFMIACAKFFSYEPSHILKIFISWILFFSLFSVLTLRKKLLRLETFIILSIPFLYVIGYSITAGDIRIALQFTEISIHQFYIPAFAALLVGSFVVTTLFQTKVIWALVLTLLLAFFISNFSMRLLYENPLGYNHKREAVDYIIKRAKNNPFSISVLDSVAYGFVDGFEYLFRYKGKMDIFNYKNPTYTISIPALPNSEVYFGDIGVLVP